MTDKELNARFAQMADAVSRVAHAQLRFQEQLGDLAGVVRQVIARQDRHEQELAEFRRQHEQELAEFRQQHEQELAEFRRRQEESDQRFNVLLQEIRFLIRQQQPPPPKEDQ